MIDDKKFSSGLTLIELMIVIAILAMLAYFAMNYFGSYKSKTSLDSTASEISSHLQQARSKSMAQEKGESWRVEFGRSGDNDFYQIFSTGGDIEPKIYLPPTIKFIDSTVDKEVEFSKLYGEISTQTVIGIFSQEQSICKIITINEEGRIFSTNWYIKDWSYRKKITFTSDSAKIPSAQIDFPVLINLSSDVDLAADAQDDFDDIIFTSSNGFTKLNHEIEKLDGATGELVAWVKVPSLSTSTIIYMYYGNDTCSNQQSVTGVWDDNYVGVWHLKEDPSGAEPQMLDSTTNDNDGTSVGSMTSGDQVAGQINGSLDFDGSDDYIAAANSIPALAIADSFTWSFWLYLETGNGAADTIIGNRYGGTASPLQFIKFTPTKFEYYIGGSNGTMDYAIPTEEWRHLVVVKNGADFTYYSNAASVDTSSTTSDMDSNPFFMGAGGAASQEATDCTIDGVRISNIARSADWITSSFNNQNSPSTLYALSVEEGI